MFNSFTTRSQVDLSTLTFLKCLITLIAYCLLKLLDLLSSSGPFFPSFVLTSLLRQYPQHIICCNLSFWCSSKCCTITSSFFPIHKFCLFRTLKHLKLLTFAVDMKLYRRISFLSDCHLHIDFNRLIAWGKSLHL